MHALFTEKHLGLFQVFYSNSFHYDIIIAYTKLACIYLQYLFQDLNSISINAVTEHESS